MSNINKFLSIIVVFMAITVLAGCQNDNATSKKQSTTTTKKAENPHTSGSIDISEFPPFENRDILDKALENIESAKSFKVITHLTAKKDGKTVGDTDFEVTYIDPEQVYFFGDDTVSEKRQEIYQLGNTEHKSFDGTKWTKSDKAYPIFNFDPDVIKEMVEKGTDFRLIGDDRQMD